jgi:hypothetical protein
MSAGVLWCLIAATELPAVNASPATAMGLTQPEANWRDVAPRAPEASLDPVAALAVWVRIPPAFRLLKVSYRMSAYGERVAGRARSARGEAGIAN